MPEEKVPPVEDEETKFRARVKERYGIEDEPEQWKEKTTRWQQAEQVAAQQAQALQEHQQALQLAAHRRAAMEQQGRREAPPPKLETEDELRELSRIDPYTGMQKLLQRERGQWQSLMARGFQDLHGTVQSTIGPMAETMLARQRAETEQTLEHAYPEAFEQGSDLFKMTQQIYYGETDPQSRLFPGSMSAAVERAAGRLGIAPMSRRGATSDRAASSDAQSAERGSRRPQGDDVLPRLTEKEDALADDFGLDKKVYAQQKKAWDVRLKAIREGRA